MSNYSIFYVGSVNCLNLIMQFFQLCSFIFFRVGACMLYGAVLVGASLVIQPEDGPRIGPKHVVVTSYNSQ